MGNVVLNCRRLFIAAVIAWTIGDFCAAFNSWQWCIILSAVAFVPLTIVHLIFGRRLTHIFALLALMAMPSSAFFLSSIRLAAHPDSCLFLPYKQGGGDVQSLSTRHWAGAPAILELSISKELHCNQSTGIITYEAMVTRMLFPRKSQLHEKTLLVLKQTHAQINPKPSIGDTILVDAQIRPQRSKDGFKRTSLGGPSTVCFGTLRRDQTQVRHVVQDLKSPEGIWESINQCGTESLLCSLRRQMAEAHTKALGNERGLLLSSMVLGDKAINMPQEIVANFRRVGLSHVLAASGFNLSIVISFLFIVGKSIFSCERKSAVLALAGMLAYTWLAGASPSVVRSAMMATVLLTSKLARRRISSTGALAAALMVTQLVDPACVGDVGLQLSYAATVGITCSATRLSEVFQMGSSRISASMAAVVGACISAQLAVLPIQVYFFHTVSLLFLPANVLILPLVAPITIVGFIASLFSLGSLSAPPFAVPLITHAIGLLDLLLSYPLDYINFVTKTLAGCQWAEVLTGEPSIASIFAYYMVWILFLLSLKSGVGVWRTLCLPLVSSLLLLAPPPLAETSILNYKNGTLIVDSQRTTCGLSLSTDGHWQIDSAATTNSRAVPEEWRKTLARLRSPYFIHLMQTTPPLESSKNEGPYDTESSTGPAAKSGVSHEPDSEKLAPPHPLHLEFLATGVGSVAQLRFNRTNWQVEEPCLDALLSRIPDASGKPQAILAVSSAESLRRVPDYAGRYLGLMKDCSIRNLIVRLDSYRRSESTPKTPPLKAMRTFLDIGEVMNSCAIDRTIVVMTVPQYQRMEPIFAECPSAPFERSPQIQGERGLIAVTVTRKQINECKRSKEELFVE